MVITFIFMCSNHLFLIYISSSSCLFSCNWIVYHYPKMIGRSIFCSSLDNPGLHILLYLCFSSFFIILNSYRIDPPPLFSCYWVVCDYPEIITEVTPTRGQKPGEGVWDNSQPRFHSSLPGIVVVLVVTIEIFTAYFWPCQPVVSFLSCFFCDVVLFNKKKVILKLPQNRVPVFTMSQNLSWCMCKLLTV